MKIEVLVSTMNQKDLSLVKKMNISSDCLIINQSDEENSTDSLINGYRNRMFTYNERGLSVSRNHAIRNANGDICVIADDDVTYDKVYIKKIKEAYDRNPEADVIAFQVSRIGDVRRKKYRKKSKKENYLSCMKISSVEITFKRKSIVDSGIEFNTLLGSGAKYFAGEENVFLYDCLRNGLKIVYVPVRIGEVSCEESSWYTGYNEQYFNSKGASYYAMSRQWYLFLILYFSLSKYKLYKSDYNIVKAFKYMIIGSNEYKKSLGGYDVKTL